MSPSFFRAPRAGRPDRVRRSRRAGRLAVEQFEARLLLSGDVLTYHNDNGRTGQYLGETELAPSNVNSATFGKLFTDRTDGSVYAQPLYKANVPIAGKGVRNVVFVATENDSIYAMDADSNVGSSAFPLWQVNFANPGAGITVPTSADIAGSVILPTVGITGTPVIDPATNTLYAVAYIKVTTGTTSVIQHVLHAVDITTGQDRASVIINPQVPGTGVGSVGGVISFQSQFQLQRPALLLVNGVVYVGMTSYADNGPYHGWLIGYNAQTLNQVGVFNTTPDAAKGGIWMSGGGPAADAQGNIYFTTGSGTFNVNLGGKSYGDSYVKLSTAGGGLAVADYFSPYNAVFLDATDGDVAASGVMLLPDIVDPATGQTHQYLVGAAKRGPLYVLNRNNLGNFNNAPNATTNNPEVVQEVTWPSLFSTPAYFNGQVYVDAPGGPINAFGVKPDGSLNPTANSKTTNTIPVHGSSVSISANGSTNGIAWVNAGGTLYAYDASDLSKTLYNSDQAGGRDALGGYTTFSVPTIANGKVYVGTQFGLVVFGLLSDKVSEVPTAPTALVATATSSTRVDLTWSNASNTAGTDQYHVQASTDGGVTFAPIGTTVPGVRSFAATGLLPSTSYVFRVTAFNSIGDSTPTNNAPAVTPSATGEINYSGGFAVGAGVAVNGNASISGSRLRLTDGSQNRIGSAFSTTPVDVSRFVSHFSFQLSGQPNVSLAEGFTFIIQGNGPTSIGGGGGGLGSWIIPKSVAVKFDLIDNVGEGGDTTGLFLNGLFPTSGGVAPKTGKLNLIDQGIDLSLGRLMDAVVSYDGTTLQVTVTDTVTGAKATQSYAVNIPNIVGGQTAFVGFTGSTSFFTAVQEIVDWTFSPGAAVAPVAPSNLTVALTAPTEIALAWRNNTASATAVLVERSTDGVTFSQIASLPATATTYTATGLIAATSYTFRVRASNAAGASAYSNAAANVVLLPPVPPTNAVASQITPTSVHLTWTDNSDNELRFEIERRTGSGTYSLLATLPANTTSYDDNALQPGLDFHYRIKAVNAAGFTDFTGIEVDTPPASVPSSPSTLAATAVSTSEIDLTWTNTATPAAAVTAVLVERSTDGVTFTQVASLAPTATTYAATGLTPGTAYTFRVRAANSAGNSPYSNTAAATTTATAPGATIDYSGGFAGATGLALTNKAAISGTRLRLTDGGPSEAASAFTAAKVPVAKFATQFSFQLTNARADGFTFAIQGGPPTSTIWGGAGLGSWQMARSVAVKFDLFDNAGEGNNSTGLFLNGAYPTTGGVAPNYGSVNLNGSGIDLHSGDVMSVAMAYDGSTLTVSITDTRTGASATQAYVVDIAAVVGGPTAYVGFTAGTGGLSAVQDILNWKFNADTAAAPPAPSGLAATAASATQVNLSWTNNGTGATSVLVERSTDGVTFTQVASLPATATTYSVTGLSPATAYTFRVRAANSAGNSPYSNTAAATTTATAPGATIDYSGGFAGATGLALTNKAAISGTRLRLTDGGPSEAASAFTAAKVPVAKFATQFSFQLTNAQADGFTFAIQGGPPTSTIWGGAGLGSWQMARSVAVKFDLFDNAGEGNNSTGLFLNGAYPTTGGVAPNYGSVNLNGSGIDLHSGDVMSVAMAYDGSTLTVSITDTRTGASATQAYVVDIAAVVGGPTAYVGFTAGTGGLSAVQDILNWKFTPTA